MAQVNLYKYKQEAPFAQRNLLSLAEWSGEDIRHCLAVALKIKNMGRGSKQAVMLAGRSLAMIFAKPSLRTRVSFEIGVMQLGGHAMVMTEAEMGLGKRESVSDIAKVLSRMVDGIMIRTFAQKTAEDLAKYGSVPVINGLTDEEHPCQALADLMTVYEKKNTFENVKFAFIGDGNNVAHSLMYACSKLGVDLAVAHAPGYAPSEAVTRHAKQFAQDAHSQLVVTTNPAAAARNADVIYTDVFTSMGQEAESEQRLRAFASYKVTDELMGMAKPDAMFLHCLPAHRGEEVDASVIDGGKSAVFDQAENRMHAQKAVLAMLLGGMTIGRI